MTDITLTPTVKDLHDTYSDLLSLMDTFHQELQEARKGLLHGNMTEAEAMYYMQVSTLLYAERLKNYVKLTASQPLIDRFGLGD